MSVRLRPKLSDHLHTWYDSPIQLPVPGTISANGIVLSRREVTCRLSRLSAFARHQGRFLGRHGGHCEKCAGLSRGWRFLYPFLGNDSGLKIQYQQVRPDYRKLLAVNDPFGLELEGVFMTGGDDFPRAIAEHGLAPSGPH